MDHFPLPWDNSVQIRRQKEGVEKMPKAYAYLRVSSQGQIEGHGFDRQLESINLFARKHGVEIVQVFQEEGISGTKDEKVRPAFKELIAEIQKKWSTNGYSRVPR